MKFGRILFSCLSCFAFALHLSCNSILLEELKNEPPVPDEVVEEEEESPDAKALPIEYKIGGYVTGLSSLGTVTIQLNGTEDLGLSTEGEYYFKKLLESGASYNVAIIRQPEGGHCSVADSQGTVMEADIRSLRIICYSDAECALSQNSPIIAKQDSNTVAIETDELTVVLTPEGLIQSVAGRECTGIKNILSSHLAETCYRELQCGGERLTYYYYTPKAQWILKDGLFPTVLWSLTPLPEEGKEKIDFPPLASMTCDEIFEELDVDLAEYGLEDQRSIDTFLASLILDREADGHIQGSNFFGELSDLDFFDGNEDGLIDAQDVIYNDLRLWSDGGDLSYVEPGEILTLTEAGIESISLIEGTFRSSRASLLQARLDEIFSSDCF